LQLARWACIIEDHYSRVRGVETPMDIEWAKDGLSPLFIVVIVIVDNYILNAS
jgi:pyruvate,water dikinase